jgi:general secretion pathway protein D
MKFRHPMIKTCFLIVSLVCASSAFAAKATLNMKDVDIRVFIETVAKLTGKPMIIDQRVKGVKVTVLSEHSMNEEEIYQTFLSVLNVNKYAVVETNGILKIIQQNQAKADSTPVLFDDMGKYVGDDLVTTVIKMNNIDVSQVQPILRGLVSQNGHIQGYKPSNVLILVESAANIIRLKKIIEQIDKKSDEGIKVIQLEHASAKEVVRIIESLEKSTGSKRANTGIKVVADERTNSVLLSGDDASQLRILDLISKLDSSTGTAGNTRVINLHYAKAADLVNVLKGVSKSIQEEENKGKASNKGRNEISIEAHEETNSLVITAQKDVMRSLEDVVRQLDIRRAQVLVEAIIVEMSETRASEIGFDWLFGHSDKGVVTMNTGSLSGAAQAAAQAGDNAGPADLLGLLSSFKGIATGLGRYDPNGFSFATLIHALKSDDDANVLSTPHITTLDNEEASLVVGQEVPIITGTALGNNNSNPFNTFDRKEVGIKLKIKPQINEGDAVRLTIEQEVSSVAPDSSADAIKTNKRQINTTVLVDDGATIVLGGLIDDTATNGASKVPLLGDIPFLGALFQTERKNRVKQRLMVFIRPTIIRDAGRMNDISSKKYNFIRAQQLYRRDEVGSEVLDDANVLPTWDDQLALPPSFDEVMEARQQKQSDKKNQDDKSEQGGDQ